MKNLILNFYSEKQIIPLPKELSCLKKAISEQYNLSLSDVNEIEIIYKIGEVKKVIKTEVDYKTFLHTRISELNLEIKESSQLYQKNLEELRNKKKDDLIKLDVLQKQKEENKIKQEKLAKETKKKIDELNNQIKTINQQKLDYVKSIKKIMRGPRNKEKELSTKITSLGTEIKAPLIYCLTDGNELPVKGETKKEIKYLELVQRITECLKVQEQLYSTPRKNMEGLDKRIKELNKQCFEIIKSSQKEMTKLKKEERNLILEIISLQKNLGIEKTLKKPMIKTGFYFPNRIQIEHLKTEKEDNNKKPLIKDLKFKANNPMNKINLPITDQKTKKKKITRKMIQKNIRHLKMKTRSKIVNTNKQIKNIMDSAKDNNIKLTSEEKELLKKVKQDNKKGKQEIDDWLQFILSHTKELIASYEKQNQTNIEKLKEIEKKLGNFKKDETLIKSNDISEKKEHPGVYCSQCKENVVGIRYKCVVCKDFNYCEKCEKIFMEKHGHPMLKINNPEMNPVSINCSFASSSSE